MKQQEKIQQLNQYFYTRRTYDVKQRIQVLKALRSSILKHQKDIVTALYADFRKPKMEAYTTEIYMTLSELQYVIHHLAKWSKPEIKQNTMPLLGGHYRILKEPYGVCLIYAPFNYPFQLAMVPLIGAVAAGNCVALKPSEWTPITNQVIKQIIRETFPPYYVTVIEGNSEVAASLLEEPIDYIFFTGSMSTGKKVMQKAAEHLTPVTLELGGKSPAIVDYDADMTLAAKRIVWGKFLNAGQTCVAPDYVLVHEAVVGKFLCEMGHQLKRQRKRPMAQIINKRQYERLARLIDKRKVYLGGLCDAESLTIEPTILYPVKPHDPCMQEEIFGPILPVIVFGRLEEAIQFVQRRPKPLACYLFGRDKQRLSHLLKHLSFGGGCINDTILQLASPNVPFGGIGYSGIGAYHGYESFKTFTHQKTIFVSHKWVMPIR